MIIPGYCVAGTVGNRLLSGERKIELDVMASPKVMLDKDVTKTATSSPSSSSSSFTSASSSASSSSSATVNPSPTVSTTETKTKQILDVKCEIAHLSFSAHADAQGIMSLIRQAGPRCVVLVHGEKLKMLHLKKRINKELNLPCFCPATGTSVLIPPAPQLKTVWMSESLEEDIQRYRHEEAVRRMEIKKAIEEEEGKEEKERDIDTNVDYNGSRSEKSMTKAINGGISSNNTAMMGDNSLNAMDQAKSNSNLQSNDSELKTSDDSEERIGIKRGRDSAIGTSIKHEELDDRTVGVIEGREGRADGGDEEGRGHEKSVKTEEMWGGDVNGNRFRIEGERQDDEAAPPPMKRRRIQDDNLNKDIDGDITTHSAPPSKLLPSTLHPPPVPSSASPSPPSTNASSSSSGSRPLPHPFPPLLAPVEGILTITNGDITRAHSLKEFSQLHQLSQLQVALKSVIDVQVVWKKNANLSSAVASATTLMSPPTTPTYSLSALVLEALKEAMYEDLGCMIEFKGESEILDGNRWENDSPTMNQLVKVEDINNNGSNATKPTGYVHPCLVLPGTSIILSCVEVKKESAFIELSWNYVDDPSGKEIEAWLKVLRLIINPLK